MRKYNSIKIYDLFNNYLDFSFFNFFIIKINKAKMREKEERRDKGGN